MNNASDFGTLGVFALQYLHAMAVNRNLICVTEPSFPSLHPHVPSMLPVDINISSHTAAYTSVESNTCTPADLSNGISTETDVINTETDVIVSRNENLTTTFTTASMMEIINDAIKEGNTVPICDIPLVNVVNAIKVVSASDYNIDTIPAFTRLQLAFSSVSEFDKMYSEISFRSLDYFTGNEKCLRRAVEVGYRLGVLLFIRGKYNEAAPYFVKAARQFSNEGWIQLECEVQKKLYICYANTRHSRLFLENCLRLICGGCPLNDIEKITVGNAIYQIAHKDYSESISSNLDGLISVGAIKILVEEENPRIVKQASCMSKKTCKKTKEITIGTKTILQLELFNSSPCVFYCDRISLRLNEMDEDSISEDNISSERGEPPVSTGTMVDCSSVNVSTGTIVGGSSVNVNLEMQHATYAEKLGVNVRSISSATETGDVLSEKAFRTSPNHLSLENQVEFTEPVLDKKNTGDASSVPFCAYLPGNEKYLTAAEIKCGPDLFSVPHPPLSTPGASAQSDPKEERGMGLCGLLTDTLTGEKMVRKSVGSSNEWINRQVNHNFTLLINVILYM